MANGEGTIGKLLNDNSVYDNIEATTASLHNASAKAQELLASLSTYSAGLNKKGTLANQLVTDTVVYNSLKTSVLQLQQIADTANVFINDIKTAGNNPKSPVGVLLHDTITGSHLKATITNLESSSVKLDDDLEALKYSIFLKGAFKKKAKAEKKKAGTGQ